MPSLRPRFFDLLLILILVAYVIASIVLFWWKPYLLTLLLILPAAILVWRVNNPRLALAMALTGVVLGPTAEACSVAGGLWSYSETGGLPLIPPWLPVAWACFVPAIWIFSRSLLGLPPAVKGSLLFALAGIGLEVLILMRLDGTAWALPAALLLAAALFLIPSRADALVVMTAGAFLGPVCETLPIAVGAWSYAHPEILGLPLWLFPAYATFALLVFQGAQAIHNLQVRSRR